SLMQQLLLSGQAHDMPSAHAAAKHQLASDLKSAEENRFDGFRKDVISAQRQVEAPIMQAAHRAVAEWRQRVQPTPAEDRAVRGILENNERTGARTLDAAYALARKALK